MYGFELVTSRSRVQSINHQITAPSFNIFVGQFVIIRHEESDLAYHSHCNVNRQRSTSNFSTYQLTIAPVLSTDMQTRGLHQTCQHNSLPQPLQCQQVNTSDLHQTSQHTSSPLQLYCQKACMREAYIKHFKIQRIDHHR